ncbi:EutN/CcmL family microcompartment protein [Myxococcota bacterium]|nr:EutN/CcmL family microcompartment protein [Myxococcota bacterium]MBU1430007.1 EutN/CcmL family microcompartment protein [Myxococcota bacterium]MBU1899846.1 EutN/CcmL family microcompartment protein [Myxococcota bacterium]
MRLARVISTVVATIKHPSYHGQKLLLCRVLTPQGALTSTRVLAVDRAQAGVGDTVLILTEGNGVRQLMGPDAGPIRSVIVGIVDAVELADEATASAP